MVRSATSVQIKSVIAAASTGPLRPRLPPRSNPSPAGPVNLWSRCIGLGRQTERGERVALALRSCSSVGTGPLCAGSRDLAAVARGRDTDAPARSSQYAKLPVIALVNAGVVPDTTSPEPAANSPSQSEESQACDPHFGDHGKVDPASYAATA